MPLDIDGFSHLVDVFEYDITIESLVLIEREMLTSDEDDDDENPKPVFPGMAIESRREESFKFWPIQMAQTPKQLADAGFFYTGKGDRLICFYCGGGLHTWRVNDDPWEQHALFYDTCIYVQVMKGTKFIEDIKKKMTPSTSLDLTELTVPTDSQQTKEKDEKSKEENQLPENRLCHICYDAEINTVFLPCCHVNSCAKCALAVSRCPICQGNIKEVKRIYFS